MPVTIDPQTGEATLDEPLTAAEKDQLVTNVGLMNFEDRGAGMDALRHLYPHWKWTEMRLHLMALVAEGRLTHKLTKPRGAKVAYEFWKVAE